MGPTRHHAHHPGTVDPNDARTHGVAPSGWSTTAPGGLPVVDAPAVQQPVAIGPGASGHAEARPCTIRPTATPPYPTVCIPPSPPDLDCGEIAYRRFTVLPPDPHRFDGDHDGIGCESS